MQSRLMSLAEAAVNVAVGYVVAVAAQVVIFPLFGISASLGDHLAIGLLFTVVSLVRSYALRRLFNALSSRGCRRVGHIEKSPCGGLIVSLDPRFSFLRSRGD